MGDEAEFELTKGRESLLLRMETQTNFDVRKMTGNLFLETPVIKCVFEE